MNCVVGALFILITCFYQTLVSTRTRTLVHGFDVNPIPSRVRKRVSFKQIDVTVAWNRTIITMDTGLVLVTLPLYCTYSFLCRVADMGVNMSVLGNFVPFQS